MSAGHTVKYLIADAENRRLDRRVIAAELIAEDAKYDRKKYLDALLSAAANILSPFDYTNERLYDTIVAKERETNL